jgi:hypothetical protein
VLTSADKKSANNSPIDFKRCGWSGLKILFMLIFPLDIIHECFLLLTRNDWQTKVKQGIINPLSTSSGRTEWSKFTALKSREDSSPHTQRGIILPSLESCQSLSAYLLRNHKIPSATTYQKFSPREETGFLEERGIA